MGGLHDGPYVWGVVVLLVVLEENKNSLIKLFQKQENTTEDSKQDCLGAANEQKCKTR